MRSSAFGMVYEPKEISEDMLPEVGTVWKDTYSSMPRSCTVLSVKSRGTEPETWSIECVENQLSRRNFTMYAHGFLSRHKQVEKME